MGIPTMGMLMPMLGHGEHRNCEFERVGDGWEEQVCVLQDETPNLPVLWTPPLDADGNVKRRFRVERLPSNANKDVPGVDDFPWYVQEITYFDDRDDYGRMATHAGALQLVVFMLKGQRYGGV